MRSRDILTIGAKMAACVAVAIGAASGCTKECLAIGYTDSIAITVAIELVVDDLCLEDKCYHETEPPSNLDSIRRRGSLVIVAPSSRLPRKPKSVSITVAGTRYTRAFPPVVEVKPTGRRCSAQRTITLRFDAQAGQLVEIG
jgi:hypothetical protein